MLEQLNQEQIDELCKDIREVNKEDATSGLRGLFKYKGSNIWLMMYESSESIGLLITLLRKCKNTNRYHYVAVTPEMLEVLKLFDYSKYNTLYGK